MRDKNFLILALALVCLFSAMFISSKLTDKQDVQKYTQAIKFYQSEDYSNAYYNFGKISTFSDLKSAALFRQARCATNLDDITSAIRNYTIFVDRFPNSSIFPVAEYNLAVLLFESRDYKGAKKHFKHIIKHFEDKDVAIASKYYLGLINNDKNLLVEYLNLSPKGSFSENVIEELKKQNNLSNSDNLAIANSYLQREEYQKSLEFYKKTTLRDSWAGFAIAKFKTGDTKTAKELTQLGLRNYSYFVEEQDIYDCIDGFVSVSDNKETTLKYLLSINSKAKGNDYILYLLAKNSPTANKLKIYQKIYTLYPDGKFAADALYNVFFNKINSNQYNEAIKLGMKHLDLYNNTNSAPAVMYWIAKAYEKRKSYNRAKSYYKKVINEYPDSYYALRANAKLHKGSMFKDGTLNVKFVEFPVNKNSRQGKMAQKLAQLGDYDLVEELYPNDDFVKSWTEYKKGKYTNSVLIARDAMDKIDNKPDFSDVRWRLVYPVHYYDLVKKYSEDQNPVVILSIIKEESHFNPSVKSPVGAVGLMQLMPATAMEIANGYGISGNLLNPASNIHLGSLYYGRIKQTLNNKDMSAIMAYNGGFGAVQRWKKQIDYRDIDDFVEKIPYPETQQYVKKVARTYWNYTRIYR